MVNWWILITTDCEMSSTSSSRLTLSNLNMQLQDLLVLARLFFDKDSTKKFFCQVSFDKDETIQHYHSCHPERKNRYRCDTKGPWVSTSGSVRKILTRSYGHTTLFMCLCGVINDDTNDQPCFISVITDCYLSFIEPVENSRQNIKRGYVSK